MGDFDWAGLLKECKEKAQKESEDVFSEKKDIERKGGITRDQQTSEKEDAGELKNLVYGNSDKRSYDFFSHVQDTIKKEKAKGNVIPEIDFGMLCYFLSLFNNDKERIAFASERIKNLEEFLEILEGLPEQNRLAFACGAVLESVKNMEEILQILDKLPKKDRLAFANDAVKTLFERLKANRNACFIEIEEDIFFGEGVLIDKNVLINGDIPIKRAKIDNFVSIDADVLTDRNVCIKGDILINGVQIDDSVLIDAGVLSDKRVLSKKKDVLIEIFKKLLETEVVVNVKADVKVDNKTDRESALWFFTTRILCAVDADLLIVKQRAEKSLHKGAKSSDQTLKSRLIERLIICVMATSNLDTFSQFIKAGSIINDLNNTEDHNVSQRVINALDYNGFYKSLVAVKKIDHRVYLLKKLKREFSRLITNATQLADVLTLLRNSSSQQKYLLIWFNRGRQNLLNNIIKTEQDLKKIRATLNSKLRIIKKDGRYIINYPKWACIWHKLWRKLPSPRNKILPVDVDIQTAHNNIFGPSISEIRAQKIIVKTIN